LQNNVKLYGSFPKTREATQIVKLSEYCQRWTSCLYKVDKWIVCI